MAEVIRLLSTEVANRIKAGEVVERPASVVKELIENALDAGATRLALDLEEGGTRLLRLRDDGEGMSPGDLARCILPHATSKIASVEDLFRVASFGFRGEALPSIASVCELSVTSRRADDEVASKIRCSDGELVGPAPSSSPVGTTVEVRNLFHQVPVRRKFLKSARAEYSRCLEMVTRLLLPETDVAIEVTHNGRKGLSLDGAASAIERVGALFGETLAGSLLELERVEEGLRLRALIAPPELVKATGRMQYVYLNGRYIKDRGLGAALREAYRGLIMPKDHPVAFLFLEMDPGLVDVNVHPTKTEVRFRSRDAVFGLVHRAVRERLAESRIDRPARFAAPQGATPVGTQEDRRDLLATIEAELFPQGVPAAPQSQRGAASDPGPKGDESGFTVRDQEVPGTGPRTGAEESHRLASGGAHPTPRSRRSHDGAYMQVHRSYLVLETDDGLRIIDQHALHERKLYEELLDRFRRAEAEDQHLLIPEVVELGRADQELLLEYRNELLELGIRVEAFGGTSICVRSLPATLGNLPPQDAIEEVLEVLRKRGTLPLREELLSEIVAHLACRAAIKFNDRLPASEIQQLLKWHAKHPEMRNCPHGRTVSIGLTLRELEDQFQRKK